MNTPITYLGIKIGEVTKVEATAEGLLVEGTIDGQGPISSFSPRPPEDAATMKRFERELLKKKRARRG